MQTQFFRFHLSSVCLMGALLLAACSSNPPADHRNQAEDAALRTLTEHAYSAGPQVSTQQKTMTLDGPDGPLQLALIEPVAAGSYPLVIYLPGLGDQVDSGSPWRKAWAEAGYAVLSVQDRFDGTPLLASEQARRGDIAGMVREATSDARRAMRVQELQAALAYAKEQAAHNQPLFASINFDKLVLAGFDTGAYTALAFSGESGSPAAADALPGLAGIIAISPTLPETFNARGRYARAQSPVMFVTSDADFDEYGIINDVGLRIAPFHAMPNEDKYLLAFKQIRHSALSGAEGREMPNEMQAREGKGRGGRGDNSGGRMPPGGGGMGGGGGPQGGGMGGGMGGGGRPDMGNGPGGQGGPGEMGGRGGQDTQGMQVVMRSVSVAFLQSYLGKNSQALDWLCLDAPRWLRPYGSLNIK